MRKVMLLAAMLAMALAAAAPAFAQTEAEVEQEAEQFGVVDDSVCSQVFNIAVQQYNAGDQVAVADADAFADANAGGGDGGQPTVTAESRGANGTVPPVDGTAAAGGDATAVAIANADAANIANAAGIDIDTVNACLNNFTVTATSTATPTAKTVTPTAKKKVVWVKGKKVIPEKVIWVKGKKHLVVVAGKTVTATSTATPTATSTATATATATAAVLPETGGASLLALGAGALLVGGGLVARRLAR